MKEIKIILWGFGAMGKSMAENIMTKDGLKIVAVLDKDEKLLLKDIGYILNKSSPYGIVVSSDFSSVVKNTDADIVLLAIDSYINKVIEYIELIIENKKNCITLTEEMVYPYSTDYKIFSKIHKLAKENNVTILGTGINSGFFWIP
ncbi:MAG: dihydrodipicolinate reductase [Clostridiaceae bacterium]|nr:dihydrodipicolinate reductase [Clostridiaceae bacterium]